MLCGYSRAFTTIGLALISFSTWIRSTPVSSLLLEKSVPSVHISSTTLAELKSYKDGDVIWRCGISPKFMIVETDLDHIVHDGDSLQGWKYYRTVTSLIGNQEPEEKWKDTHITYSVHEYDRFPKPKVDECLSRALAIWSQASPRLKFEQIEDKAMHANIRLRFVKKFLEPGYSSLTAAHAFFPPQAGTRFMEFRAKERWTLDRGFGTNALMIATHEFGHALGLYHSDVSAALMHADVLYRKGIKVILHSDDIKAIQSLYGDMPSPPRSPSISSESSSSESSSSVSSSSRPSSPGFSSSVSSSSVSSSSESSSSVSSSSRPSSPGFSSSVSSSSVSSLSESSSSGSSSSESNTFGSSSSTSTDSSDEIPWGSTGRNGESDGNVGNGWQGVVYPVDGEDLVS